MAKRSNFAKTRSTDSPAASSGTRVITKTRAEVNRLRPPHLLAALASRLGTGLEPGGDGTCLRIPAAMTRAG